MGKETWKGRLSRREGKEGEQTREGRVGKTAKAGPERRKEMIRGRKPRSRSSVAGMRAGGRSSIAELFLRTRVLLICLFSISLHIEVRRSQLIM